MAILITHDNGWIISHEFFIKNTYQKTNHNNEVKSYYLNPVLFDIRIPFFKRKCAENRNESGASDVEIVKKAYKNLFTSYEALNLCSTVTHPESNCLAKSLSNKFYCQLIQHSDSQFLGGNSSQEALVSEIGEELYLIPEKSLFYCFDMKYISEHLINRKFDLILMDPPWWNKCIRRKRKKNHKFGYDMLYDRDLCDIPINSLLSEDGIIAVWCTSAPSHINSVLTELFPAWNVQFITQWFWLKITKHGKPVCDFSQNLGKQPFERIIFGKKEKSLRIIPNPESKKVIMSVPSAIHSHKPPLCDLLKPYLPREPKCLELFARYLLPNWTSYGNEVLKLQHMSLYIEANM